MCILFFFFNDTATTEIYTLSLHDALPILHRVRDGHPELHEPQHHHQQQPQQHPVLARGPEPPERRAAEQEDRKSTRLNSSHANISYAVFCLKKKKKKKHNNIT